MLILSNLKQYAIVLKKTNVCKKIKNKVITSPNHPSIEVCRSSHYSSIVFSNHNCLLLPHCWRVKVAFPYSQRHITEQLQHQIVATRMTVRGSSISHTSSAATNPNEEQKRYEAHSNIQTVYSRIRLLQNKPNIIGSLFFLHSFNDLPKPLVVFCFFLAASLWRWLWINLKSLYIIGLY